ncbi:hypothetical protein MJA45_00120 [Paenibacillus aurantius]|uniref:Multi-tm2 domain protein n=1 Tax=Paenibacillus aurantius TaxID=2918900 RepID=A0AA96LG86_9BACL|nr:hypothetical protein [Paenibacillus aurantius]WNQ11525.1 hypothetical protein MJA45_00120 [Paenibacillus aurantius]
MHRNVVVALLMAVIPGMGHLYMNRTIRGLLYGGLFFGPLALAFLFVVSNNGIHKEVMVPVLFAGVVWIINMIDMVFTLVNYRPAPGYGYPDPRAAGNPNLSGSFSEAGGAGPVPSDGAPWPGTSERQHNERVFTILLSFIPGLGHLQLGLMQRGLAFLISFFGLFTMIVFVTFVTRLEGFLVFLFGLPIIWLYCMFDAVQLVHRKQKGEELQDKSIFEELEENREQGRKSRIAATLLAVVPGAGHMYLGLQRRGLQFMAAFLLSIYVLDTLRLSLFLFLIPIIWCYSLFDALQNISKYGREELKDTPLVDWLMNHQRWIGIALLALGGYYLLDNMLLPILDRYAPELRLAWRFHAYFQTVLVSLLLIGGGIKLMAGSGKPKGKEGEE